MCFTDFKYISALVAVNTQWNLHFCGLQDVLLCVYDSQGFPDLISSPFIPNEPHTKCHKSPPMTFFFTALKTTWEKGHLNNSDALLLLYLTVTQNMWETKKRDRDSKLCH